MKKHDITNIRGIVMIKFIMFTLILIATLMADAAYYDVSVLTINKKQYIEIIVNDKRCLFETTQKELDNFSQKDAVRLVNQCLSK